MQGSRLWLWWRRRRLNLQILDIASAEEDVLVDFVASGDLYPVLLAPFGSKRPHIAEADAGLLGVDVVEDALVPDLALGGEADEAPEVRLRGRRPGRRLARGGGGGGGRRWWRRFRRHGWQLGLGCTSEGREGEKIGRAHV